MKKCQLLLAMLFVSLYSFAQAENNGTIYIKHPNIDVVNKAQKAYLAQDVAALKSYYADTATFWVSGMHDFVSIDEAIKMWMNDFATFDSIKQTTFGYPDYLEYKKENAKIVQSWWNLSGRSKKTGEKVSLQMVMFDDFNKDGKITREYIFGDFSQWSAEANAIREADVRKVAHALADALSKNDANALDKIYGDKFIFIGDDNKPQLKKERLDLIKSGALHYDKIDMKIDDIRIAGNVAVVSFDILLRGKMNGTPLDGRYLTTTTFEKQADKWIEVSAVSKKVK